MDTDVDFQRLMRDTTTPEPGSVERGDALMYSAEDGTAPRTIPTEDASQHALMKTEESATGSVSWSVYATFVKASGSIWNLAIVIAVLAIAQGANILTTVWLS